MHQSNNIQEVAKTNSKQQLINGVSLAISLFLTSYAALIYCIFILYLVGTVLGISALKIRLRAIPEVNPWILNTMALISSLITFKTHKWLTILNVRMLISAVIGFFCFTMFFVLTFSDEP